MNLKVSGIAGAAGFALSLLIGLFSGGAPGPSLLRAVFFGLVFFALGWLIWFFINRFLPELLMPPEEEPLMTGLEPGSRVNISLGDDETPVNAAVPAENGSPGEMGNVSELTASPAQDPVPDSLPQAELNLTGNAVIPAGIPVLDLGNEEGYSKNRAAAGPGETKQSGSPAVSGAAAPAEESGAVFTPLPPPSPLQSSSGADSGSGIETLPDLDAMAGAFMSSDEQEGEEPAASIFGVEPKPREPGKAKSREDDYNPKEVASAIQTILKRD